MEMNRAELAAVDGVACDLLDSRGRLVITPNALTCDGQRNVPADLQPGETLEAFLRRHVPGISSGAWTVMIGGATVPRSMWVRTWPKHGQLISCRASVGKQAVALVAMAALAYFSMGMATGIYGAMGGTFVSAAAGAYIGAIQVGVLMAGSMLINKVLGPKVPKMGEAAAARQVYSLTSQRNSARPYEPLPVLWGEMRVTPDLAGQPYTWFDGDNQYLSTVLLGGINVHSAADLSVGDTPLSSFEEVSVFHNGFSGMASEEIPLYGNVDAIAGADLENDGEWVKRTTSTDTVVVQLDVEGQLYDIDNKGNTLVNSVPLFIETRLVGAGNWQAAHSVTLTNATLDVVRRTYTVAVAQGQHEVRMRLGKPSYDEGSGKDACKFVWTALKSIQPDTADYSGLGRIGIKIKATGQLSGSLDTVRATYRARPLPVWNGTEWITATTRAEGLSNCGAILLQTLRGVYANGVLQFGFGMSDEQIDIEGLKAFMLHCTARGYTYDRWVTSSMSLGQFCEEVALAGMGEFSWTDGSRPTAVFVSSGQPLSGVVNMANMLKGSFSVAYNLANAADGIEYEYLDRDRNWETQTLRVAAPGVTTMLNPARITGEGVTTEAHAAVLARYHLAQSLYQYKTIDFGADIEHLAYRRLSVLSISHDLTQWGYGGRVMAAVLSAAGKVELQLDEPVPPMAQGYVGLRVPGARDYRVFRVEEFEGESEWITLVEPWPEELDFPGEDLNNPAWDTLWCYDFKATPGYRVRVVGMQPEADLKGAQVTCVPEGPEFWDYVLNGTYTPAPNQSSLPQLARPKVSKLRITEKVNVQGDTEWYSLSLVWDVEGDYDHAQVWAGRDGSELRLVDGNAMGSRSEFRIDGAGEWLVEVRPFNASGLVGQSVTVLYVTSKAERTPRNVDTFTAQQVAGELRRFTWSYDGDQRPANFAGVQIRYAPGTVNLSVADWDNLTPIGTAEDIYTAALETTRPDAGTWTFACRAVNTAGQLANGVRTATATLQAPFTEIKETIDEMTEGLDDVLELITAEISDRVNADATGALTAAQALAAEQAARAEAINQAAQQLQQQIQALQAQIGDILGAAEYAADQAYDPGDLVVYNDKLYRALQASIGVVPATGAYWQMVGDYANIAEAVVAQAAQISEASSRITQVGADVSALSTAHTSLAGRLTTAEGNLSAQSGALSSLQQTVSNQGSALVANSSAITALNSKITSRPNLLPNGSFERGKKGWTGDFAVNDSPEWGKWATRWGASNTPVSGNFSYDPLPVQSGAEYTISGDSLMIGATTGLVSFDLIFRDSAGNVLLDGPNGHISVNHNFSSSDSNRNQHAVSAHAPAGSTQVLVRFVYENVTGNASTVIGCRMIKLERGGLPATAYSADAAIAAESAAATLLEQRVKTNEAGLTAASESLTSLTNRVGATESQTSASSRAITGLQSEVSTINGALNSYGSQMTRLEARLGSRPNLLPNGGFELGAKGWQTNGWSIENSGYWGMVAVRSGLTGTVTLLSEPFPAEAGATYSIAGDSLMMNQTAGTVYFDLQFGNAAGVTLAGGDGPQRAIATSHDFSSGDTTREAHAVSAVAPTGTKTVRARFVAEGITGGATVGCRLIKVERGGLPVTGYSMEASMMAEGTAVSSLTTKVTQAEANITAQANQYTGLSSTVAGHTASISQQASTLASLNGQIQSTWVLSVTAGGKVAGMVVNNDGVRRDMVFLTDRFAVAQNDQDAGKYPFVIGTAGGAPSAVFNANLFVDGGLQARHIGAKQVTTDKMLVNQLSALTQDVGDLTAGVIRNPSSTNYFNLNATGGQWALCAGGGKFYARADGYVEADRVNIRRRDVIATGNAYWGGEWLASGGGNGLFANLDGAFSIDTGIDLSDAGDFGVVQPYYVIAACNNASTMGGGTGNTRQFDLTISCQVALGSTHTPNSGSQPTPSPRLRIIVRVMASGLHPALSRIQLNTFNWSLFRA